MQTRRTFLTMTAASITAATGLGARPEARPTRVRQTAGSARAEGTTYAWEWSSREDRFVLFDGKGRVVTRGTLQPTVVVQPAGQKGERTCAAGRVAGAESAGAKLTVRYEGVNHASNLTVTLRFEEDGFWMEPVEYQSGSAEDIVSLHYFSSSDGKAAQPTLECSHWIHPGISESAAVGPVVDTGTRLTLTSWLGHGSFLAGGLLQQWALPVHYFCGFHRNSRSINEEGALTRHLSDSFCCGLADLPAGNLFLELNGPRAAVTASYRSDLWGQLRGPGSLSLGATLYWTLGPNYYEAIRGYYLGLVRAGIIGKKTVSEKKAAVMLAPQFNTWGAEVARGREWGKFHQADMDDFYAGMKSAGMKAGMFVIDAKWEGKYGELAHNAKQFPRFEESIERMRSEGMRIGMWAAFLRCENPADLGLTHDHLLRAPDGRPFSSTDNLVNYYLLDFTQPEVQKALRELARKFMRRYRPDLVKFDFGYEIPALHAAAPKDMRYAGERILKKGVEVVVGAMREENPDLVVMYYSLSPLFIDFFDLHSPDDLFLCQNEYDLEANRRFFFSSLLGELGMPTYGSGGYDWPTSPSIWFDSAAIGTLGSLLSFRGDEQDTRPKPEWTAKFNGVAQALRPTTLFRIEPLDAEFLGPVRGARSSSWARLEDGKLTLVALRAWRLDGRKGTGNYRDLVTTNASVIVASKTADDIVRASTLALVPFGDGEVRIKREGAAAKAREHSFGGGVKEIRTVFRDGALRLPVRERTEAGSPVEWIEVNFT